MRNTSDIMEDNASEDAMMDCAEDEKELDDLMELAVNIADSSPTIRDAAERLLTLLGVDEDNDDFSSEDEGVELDLDETDDEDSPQNSRLLQQLAASLAQELKFAQRQNTISTSRTIQTRSNFDPNDFQKKVQSLEISPKSSFHSQQDNEKKIFSDSYRESSLLKCIETKETYSSSSHKVKKFGGPVYHSSEHESLKRRCPYSRVKTDKFESGKKEKLTNQDTNLTTWNAGWDACASEALRYLVEDEGLPPHHPTVLAMKNHLDLQREQAFVRTGCH